jgi:amino acid transporter
MGVVILAGTAGAVNSLFGTVSRMMSAMASAGLLPPVFGNKWFKGRFAPFCLTAAAAMMLFTGMAGSDHLDAFLRGSLILWLFHYSALHFAYFEDRRHETFRWDRKRHLAVAILLTLIGLGLLVTDAERGVVGAFMFVCVGSMLILLLLWSGLTRTPDQDESVS